MVQIIPVNIIGMETTLRAHKISYPVLRYITNINQNEVSSIPDPVLFTLYLDRSRRGSLLWRGLRGIRLRERGSRCLLFARQGPGMEHHFWGMYVDIRRRIEDRLMELPDLQCGSDTRRSCPDREGVLELCR